MNKDGEINIIYKQNNNTGRCYSNKFLLQNMFNEVRSSIIHKNCLDVDFENSIVTIIIYLAEKYNLKIPNIVKYSKDRENILKQINNDRMTAKKVIISILNGGFQINIMMIKILINFYNILKKKRNLYMNVFMKLIKELMMKKFIIIKVKILVVFCKIMKINY